jgi:predicted MFS family arabinose efflux permease
VASSADRAGLTAVETMPRIAAEQGIARGTVWFLALSVGVIVVNLTAPQTLVGPIAADLGMLPAQAGLVGTASLLGYAAGLFFLVPLSDLVENRRLTIVMLGAAVLAALAAAVTRAAVPFLALLFILGAACSAIQVLVPIAAAMARPSDRGRVVGDVMSGLMVGILLSRPLASLVADLLGWRVFYLLSGASMAALVPLMGLRLPVRRPDTRTRYPSLIVSLATLLRREPVLRRRALTAAFGLAAFSVFWTAVALRLAAAPFGFDQRHVALFALAGASGAVVAPFAGRAGDRGWSRPLLIGAHLITILAFGLAWLADHLGDGLLPALMLLVLAAIVVDVGVVGDQTLGRRAVNLLAPEARGRVNALFVGIFFLGGAAGSGVAGFAWAQGGWPLVCAAGAVFGSLSLISDLLGGSSQDGTQLPR